MDEHYGQALRQRIVDLKLYDLEKAPLRGCTLEEIDRIKEFQEIGYIPEIYRQFLLIAGYGAGLLFSGSDYSYGWLSRLKTHARRLIAESKTDFVLPADAFVFLGHQGYIYIYFTISDHNDNPLVFGIYEIKNGLEIKTLSPTLTEFYEGEIEGWLKLRERKDKPRMGKAQTNHSKD